MGRADVERLASHSAPPIEWGKKPSPRCGYVREETERPGSEIIVVVVYYILLKDNYCWSDELRHSLFCC